MTHPDVSPPSQSSMNAEARTRLSTQAITPGLSAYPSGSPRAADLFYVMAVSRAWFEAARANYARRVRHVAAQQDELLRAVAAASPGDTLLLQPGLHWLSSEFLIEKQLRVQAQTPGAATVLATRCPSLLRTRCNVMLNGLTFCRMGDEEGYPNAVVVAEGGLLCMDGCRVTCGGAAPSVEHALRAFEGAPAPGEAWPRDRLPPGDPAESHADEAQPRSGPQSGVWVGSGAHVKLRRCTLSRCSGPGVKIYRGRLEAVGNTIAFSRCGANVVANSGRVVLMHNEIHGARGDGVSSWNNSQMRVERNSIHSNEGTGVTINTGGGSVTIDGNSFSDNMHTAVQFATSSVKKVKLSNNDWSRNAAGGCHGLSQPQPQLQRMQAAPIDAPSPMDVDASAASTEPGSRSSEVGSSRGSVEIDAQLVCPCVIDVLTYRTPRARFPLETCLDPSVLEQCASASPDSRALSMWVPSSPWYVAAFFLQLVSSRITYVRQIQAFFDVSDAKRAANGSSPLTPFRTLVTHPTSE
eukprot:CAMPEP_0181216816 /NCGR_PEP_ID=MMETSP1096-20121128/26801_1 /TAXON_ID=156174 ORGANISM="Chrysochromulina ericina, Strain CCMP281" /NCGR_SAMPLE_ID=MMETSP1096 /ASSEMBLY_ACC=CAM_ASM_000453 /LENGTH=522 /DNA_ID=CAMNT_0023308869 /DNA_START=824 /DNA_END=2394 /DNA_ORIENTATION=-